MRFHLLKYCFLKTDVIDCRFTKSGNSTAIDNTELVWTSYKRLPESQLLQRRISILASVTSGKECLAWCKNSTESLKIELIMRCTQGTDISFETFRINLKHKALLIPNKRIFPNSPCSLKAWIRHAFRILQQTLLKPQWPGRTNRFAINASEENWRGGQYL